MRKLIAIKDLAYADGITGLNDLDLLTDGALAVFDQDNNLLNITVAAPSTVSKFYFAVGTANGTHISPLIDRDSGEYTQQLYSAPVTQVSYLGFDGVADGALNLPTLVEGDIAFVRISDTSRGFVPPVDIKRYEYVVQPGDTAAEVLTGIVDKVNNDPTSFVTAAIVGANLGIEFTANDDYIAALQMGRGAHFEIGHDGVFLNSDVIENGVGASVAGTIGSGDGRIVAALEEEFTPERGNTNKIWQSQYWYNAPRMVIAGVNYDMYDITWTQLKASPIAPAFASDQLQYIAHPTSPAVFDDGSFEAFMETLLP
jgi:hypothetical protein